MYKQTPAVYIPVEPENNGIVLPSFLSVLVHGGIIAFILFFHHIPSIDTPKPIETTLVTPEELASLQAQVIKNREAAESESKTEFDPAPGVPDFSSASSTTDTTLATPAYTQSDRRPMVSSSSNTGSSSISSSSSSQNTFNETPTASTFREQLPIFSRSDAPPDSPSVITTPRSDTSSTSVSSQPTTADSDPVESAVKPSVKKVQEKRDAQAEALRLFEEQRAFELEEDMELFELEMQEDSSTSSPSKNTKPQGTAGSKNASGAGGKSGIAKDALSSKPVAKEPSNTRSKGEITQAVLGQISNKWVKPTEQFGTSITMRIPVDPKTGSVNMGGVRRVAGNAALEPSIKEAIRNAGPLKAVIGSSYTSLNLEFVIKNR